MHNYIGNIANVATAMGVEEWQWLSYKEDINELRQ